MENKTDLLAFCDEYIKPYYASDHEEDYQFVKDALLQRFVEHCDEPKCPECDLEAYRRGRRDMLEEIRRILRGKFTDEQVKQLTDE